jgi:limonene-1,2-epoxide hydrolase
MSAPSPLDVVRQFLKDMERLDYDAALHWVAETCEYVNPPPIPVVHGPAGVRGLLEPFFAPTLHNEFRLVREAAHQLADKWVELPVTGVFEVEGGKIVYWRDYFDAESILSQWPAG